MFGDFDHVGLFVLDLDGAVAQARAALGLEIARTAVLAGYGIDAVFLGPGNGTLEIFTCSDTELRDRRLDGRDRRLDHIAFRVDGLDAIGAALRAAGGRFTSPDRREEVTEPIELGGVRHLWTVPDSTGGVALQLTERPAP